ncbi:hypothetical protein [Allostreptomyces psammosilenae]|uniref:Uncharacterized protein n=1 Tax=Allostreptomyces psammosilenae TaxID=1892865 RepID=A0A853A0L0_9ACTN|nr:hypothetical protein [Allostreptomyces psammosilenae]NYI07667.1 hypothetical protein [Allostreptomyces psammosilenae]
MRHRTRNAALAAVALIALGGGYYGLSAGGGEGDAAGGGPSPAERAAALDLTLPLDAYRLDHAAESEVRRARDLLIRDCMEQAGFEWYVSTEASADIDPARRRYGVIDPGVAERYGYHLPPDPRSAEVERVRSETLAEPGAEAAYFGPAESEEGCVTSADERIARGAGEADHALFTDLDFGSLDRSDLHPDVVAAKEDWRECMSARGHSYDTPRDAAGDEAWDLDAPEATEAERAVAAADVACKHEVGLVETWVRAETDIQRDMVAEHAAELERVGAANATYLENARAVLAELGGG